MTTTLPHTHNSVRRIRQAGVLRTAVSLGIPGLSAQDRSGRWTGIDVDFARTVAAALVGDSEAVQWIPVAPGDRIEAIRSGMADLGACNTSWTLSREAKVLFAGVLCHDGERFLVHADLGVEGIDQLAGRRLAIQAGTTTAENVARWQAGGGPDVQLVASPTPEQTLSSYLGRDCDGYILDRTALAGIRASLADPQAHHLLDDTISDEPLAPFVATDAPDLLVVVRWCLNLLITAEAAGRTAQTLPINEINQLGPEFDLDTSWASRVLQTGHYGNIYARNLGERSPLRIPRGRNDLWLDGGLHYAPPLRLLARSLQDRVVHTNFLGRKS